MKARSFFVVIRAAEGRLLLGGVRDLVSSRFASEHDAHAYRSEICREQGNRIAYAGVHASEAYPEIAAQEGGAA